MLCMPKEEERCGITIGLEKRGGWRRAIGGRGGGGGGGRKKRE
jgi:hypothetical protein